MVLANMIMWDWHSHSTLHTTGGAISINRIVIGNHPDWCTDVEFHTVRHPIAGWCGFEVEECDCKSCTYRS